MQFTASDDLRKYTSVDTISIWSQNMKKQQKSSKQMHFTYKTALPAIIFIKFGILTYTYYPPTFIFKLYISLSVFFLRKKSASASPIFHLKLNPGTLDPFSSFCGLLYNTQVPQCTYLKQKLYVPFADAWLASSKCPLSDTFYGQATLLLLVSKPLYTIQTWEQIQK